MTTQAPSQQSEDEDGVGFMARDDASRSAAAVQCACVHVIIGLWFGNSDNNSK